MTERVEEEWERRSRLEREWLAALKVGDEVLLPNQWHESIGKIERETPTQWIIGHHRFNKKNGHSVGGRGYLKQPTDEIRDTLEKFQLAQWVESLVRHGRTDVSLAKLRAMKLAHDNTP